LLIEQEILSLWTNKGTEITSSTVKRQERESELHIHVEPTLKIKGFIPPLPSMVSKQVIKHQDLPLPPHTKELT